ncbi:serine hydrolase domain-containing protein [Marilutibacter chinensis]|uniref:Beta-lactamase family protein n=1 Tax=Marilutibacter chinensis TaxID=2912247 RepID=A0ABS9HP16_9GAMM|nr:serine hydrolase domain-containing protein [Lysobacter chinensis]MCF7220724.1 beta-lactamase family protein [Lysobacter chinensis]
MIKDSPACSTNMRSKVGTVVCCLAVMTSLHAVAGSRVPDPAEPACTETAAAARIQNNLLPFHYLEGQVSTSSIPQQMLAQDIPGVSIAFVDDGKIAWCLTYGYGRLADAERVTPETVFTAASLSKPVAAMTALALVDRGQLELDGDVNAQLVDWKIPESEFLTDHKVTLRHLIGHTAGIKNHVSTSYGIDDDIPTLEQMLAGTGPSVDPAVTVVATPGERYKYSNPGYSIVQKLVQDATGQDFQTVVERLVFTLAGMDDSSFSQPAPARLMERAATGYSNELRPYPYMIFPFQAAGGLWTTPSDLATFMATIIDDYHTGRGTLISRGMAEEVFSRSEVRLGFAKKLGADDDLIFEHWGSNAGFTSYMVGSLKDRQGLVIMTNSDNGFGLMASIARSVALEYGWAPLEPVVYRPVSTPLDHPERFTGRFGNRADASQTLVFSLQDDALHVLTASAESPQALVQVADRKYILPSRHTTYEFLEGKDGIVTWVRVTTESSYNYDLPRND